MGEPLFKAAFAAHRGNSRGERLSQLFFMGEIEQWLRDRQLSDHLVNIYRNENDVTVVLNDRDTAIMLKLALA